MDTTFAWVRALTAAAFFVFGILCLASPHMEAEFARYGLARWRILIGTLETCGAVGLVISMRQPALLVPAAAGLGLLMLLGVITRIRIQDPFSSMVPALALLMMNAFLLARALNTGRTA